MSIAAAVRQAYTVEAEAKSTEFRKASAQPDVESALEEVTQWIPSEAVGLYVAFLGLFSPDSTDGRWILFGVGVVLVVFFVIVNSALVNTRGAREWRRQGKQGDPPKLSPRRVLLVMAFSMVAFVAWAAALPASPFLDWWSDATIVGGAAVLLLAAGLPKLAELADLKAPQA